MTPLFVFFSRHPGIPLTSTLPETAVDHRAAEYVQALQSRLQQALDLGREAQIKMVDEMDSD